MLQNSVGEVLQNFVDEMGGDVDIVEGMHVHQVVAAEIEKDRLLMALKQDPIVSKCNRSSGRSLGENRRTTCNKK
jgi:hypothetical protein